MKKSDRNEARVDLKRAVNLRVNGQVFSGTTKNLSTRGMYVEAIDLVPKTGGRLSILLAADDQLYRLTGKIRWNHELQASDPCQCLHGIGISLEEVPADYLNYVEYIRYQHKKSH